MKLEVARFFTFFLQLLFITPGQFGNCYTKFLQIGCPILIDLYCKHKSCCIIHYQLPDQSFPSPMPRGLSHQQLMGAAHTLPFLISLRNFPDWVEVKPLCAPGRTKLVQVQETYAACPRRSSASPFAHPEMLLFPLYKVL